MPTRTPVLSPTRSLPTNLGLPYQKHRQGQSPRQTQRQSPRQWRRSDAQRQSGGGLKGMKRDKVQRRRKGKSSVSKINDETKCYLLR
jgi:hypothetical protein